MHVVALKLCFQRLFFKFLEGVAEFYKWLELRAILRYILAKFKSPNSYRARDLDVQTDRLTFSIVITILATINCCSLDLNEVLRILNMQEIP